MGRCIHMGRVCEHLNPDMLPLGKELEFVTHARKWGTSVGIVVQKRAVDRLGIGPGDEVRVLIRRTRSLASMVPSV